MNYKKLLFDQKKVYVIVSFCMTMSLHAAIVPVVRVVTNLSPSYACFVVRNFGTESFVARVASFTTSTANNIRNVQAVTLVRYQKLRQYFQEKLSHEAVSDSLESKEFFIDKSSGHISKKISSLAGDNNAWFGGKAGSVTYIEKQLIIHGKKSWAESFFEWIDKGKQTKALVAGFIAGGITGYGIRGFVSTPDTKEKIIVVQAQS